MTSIGEYSGELMIKGKYGMVSPDNGKWDVFITGVHRGVELSQRRVKKLSLRIFELVGAEFIELTSESHARVQGNEAGFLCASVLGVRLKRRVSVKLIETLRKNRHASSNYE